MSHTIEVIMHKSCHFLYFENGKSYILKRIIKILRRRI